MSTRRAKTLDEALDVLDAAEKQSSPVYNPTVRTALRPMRVLAKAPCSFNPEEAFIPESDAFFHAALHAILEPALVDRPSVQLAAIYSGGSSRDFFWLMRRAVELAHHHRLDRVDTRAMRAVVRRARIDESRGLLIPDLVALLAIHRTNRIELDEHRRYLDEGRIFECHEDEVWYEVHPLLWSLIQPREERGCDQRVSIISRA